MNYKQKLLKEFEETITKKLREVNEIQNEYERAYKLETLYKMHKFFLHYEELEPIIEKYHIKNMKKQKKDDNNREK